MADEKNNTPQLEEFEAKLPAQANHKDIWLFLIIVDVIFLCVFGFFLYKNLSARLLAPQEPAKKPLATAEEVQSVAEQEEVVLVQDEVTLPQAVPAAEPVEPEPAPIAETPVEEPKVAPAEDAQPQEPAVEKKESVIIKQKANSKYRQVTFRYYGEGKKVAVVSGFTMAKPRALTKRDGYWETTLSISPGTYKFLYVVDGQQITDPYSEEKDGRSLLVVK
ncbi:MAG: hypothetical protein IKJ44_01015 [Elusimicrobiaceae bacterium]|nr:hypothetical protein [Elusimicrobiaceae bacterium]